VIFYYLEKQQPEEAEKYVEDLVRNHHNIPDNLFILGYAMRFLEKYGQAESYFKQAIEQDPQYSRAYAGLIYILALSPRIESDRERFAEIVENVLENQVNSVEVLTALAERSQAYEYDKELFYRENLNISSSDTYGQLAAARYYVRYQKWEKAKNYYLLALKDPDISSSILIELYELYHNLGEDKALEQVLADVLKAEDNYIQNYQRLQLRLKAQKIPLIAVQYPMRSTRPLEHIFQDKSDVWLVDNEDSFQQIVATEGFERVFIDSFAGDFGHCNEFGNQLLATNIMKVIINNWQDLGLTSR
jgi:tetratricopeptide (TPR) repeat protein